jgi:DNA-binding MarR family transcriptional regulator
MVGERETRPQSSRVKPTASRFTHRQGQYLAYFYFYRKLHRIGPAQADLARFFRVAPPTVHQMITTLKKLGLAVDEPGAPRSIRVAIPKEEIPELEDESPYDD